MAKKKARSQQVEPTRRQAAMSRRGRNAQRIVLIVFAGIVPILILAVLVVGLVQVGVLAPERPVAVVNGEEITVRDFRQRVRLSYSLQTQGSTQNQASPAIDVELLGENTLDGMIDNVLLRQEAAERGITVSEVEIEDEIRRTLGFRPTGEGEPDPTPTATPDVTLTPTSTFVLTLTPSPTLEDAPEGTPTPVDSSQVEGTAQEAAETSEDSTPTSTSTPQTPSEEENEAFRSAYEENLEQWMDASGMSEAGIRQLFADQVLIDKLFEAVSEDVATTTEQSLFAVILLGTPDEAEAVLQRLDAGEAFSELAAEVSLDVETAYRGGEVGWVLREQLESYSPELAEFVFSQPIGEPGGPIETIQGPLVVVVYDRVDGAQRPPADLATERQQAFQSFVTNLRVDAADSIEINENWRRVLPDL